MIFVGRRHEIDQHVLDGMFRLRKDVFFTELGWEVSVQGEYEIDEYDNDDTLYVISVCKYSNIVTGSFRFIDTTKKNMLNEIFGSFFDNPVNICSPHIWECTRFCIDVEARSNSIMLHNATAVLMQAGLEVALESGIKQIQGVYQLAAARLYRKIGWEPKKIASAFVGDQKKIEVVCGIWDVDQIYLDVLSKRTGFQSVLLNHSSKSLAA